MATGKKARDLFTRTAPRKVSIGLEVAPRVRGRPPAGEAYGKVTVCLLDRQVLTLDKIAIAIRERTGECVKRAELIRAIVDKATAKLQPDAPDFDEAVRDLLPGLTGRA
jgi:hypothetical protein